MPAMVYQWRSGARLQIDAQHAGEEVERLRKKANGQLAPTAVVSAARDPRSILHPAFEWDDGVAAERFREDQARYLIGALVVTVKPRDVQRQVRAFVNVTKGDDQGYTALHEALSDKDLRAQVLAKAWQELQAWHQRYAGYSELAEVHSAIEALEGKQKRVG